MEAALDAVGDRTRRVLLASLQDGPRSVVELAGQVTVGRPAVSQHLKILKEAGLVRDEARGTRRLYELNPEGIDALQRYTSSLWASALERFSDVAATTDPTEPAPAKAKARRK